MKSKLQVTKISIAAFLILAFVSCKSLQHSVYYQESKFPNDLDSVRLNFLSDSIVEISSRVDSQKFKFYRLGKHYYKIIAGNAKSNSEFNYLTTDTLVVKGRKIYYFSDEVKLVFHNKSK